LEQLIAHPNQPAKRVIHWLNLLADLQVKHGAAFETIHATVLRIAELYPNSADAQRALHRLDRIKLELRSRQTSQTVKLGNYEQDIGLKMKKPSADEL
jgi:hypothetical protein